MSDEIQSSSITECQTSELSSVVCTLLRLGQTRALDALLLDFPDSVRAKIQSLTSPGGFTDAPVCDEHGDECSKFVEWSKADAALRTVISLGTKYVSVSTGCSNESEIIAEMLKLLEIVGRRASDLFEPATARAKMLLAMQGFTRGSRAAVNENAWSKVCEYAVPQILDPRLSTSAESIVQHARLGYPVKLKEITRLSVDGEIWALQSVPLTVRSDGVGLQDGNISLDPSASSHGCPKWCVLVGTSKGSLYCITDKQQSAQAVKLRNFNSVDGGIRGIDIVPVLNGPCDLGESKYIALCQRSGPELNLFCISENPCNFQHPLEVVHTADWDMEDLDDVSASPEQNMGDETQPRSSEEVTPVVTGFVGMDGWIYAASSRNNRKLHFLLIDGSDGPIDDPEADASDLYPTTAAVHLFPARISDVKRICSGPYDTITSRERYLAVGTVDGCVSVIKCARNLDQRDELTVSLISTIEFNGPIVSLGVSDLSNTSSSSALTSSSSTLLVSVMSFESRTTVIHVCDPFAKSNKAALTGHKVTRFCVRCCLLDRHLAISGCATGRVHVWDAETGSHLLSERIHAVSCCCVTSISGNMIASGGDDGVVQISEVVKSFNS